MHDQLSHSCSNGTSHCLCKHISHYFHIPSPAGFMVTSHTSQHQCARRTQNLKSVISILKNFVKNEYIFSIKEFKPDHSAIKRHCGLRLFSKLIKLYRICTLFMYCKSRSFIVLLVILTNKEIPGAGNNAKVRTELTCSYVCL